jgi:hypothetical protein
VFMRAKVNRNSWEGLKFVDNIVHPTWQIFAHKGLATQKLQTIVQTWGLGIN